MGDLAIGWFVVPGALAAFLGSVVGAAWNHFSRKELRALESDLRRREETFRIAQSPRVVAAIDLWIALRKYERSFAARLKPVQEVVLPESATNADWDRLSEEHDRAQRRDQRRAWDIFTEARDKAEVLLPSDVFKTFAAAFQAYAAAHDEQWWMDLPGAVHQPENVAKRDEHLRQAQESRRAALVALQTLLGPAVA